jgi:hypothetical protein
VNAACAVNCVWSWSTCSSGTQTYTITTPVSGSGTTCAYTNNQTQSCGTTGACDTSTFGGCASVWWSGSLVNNGCGNNTTWSCLWVSGWSDVTCSKLNSGCPIAGVCGTENGKTLADTTTITWSWACSIGSRSAISGTGPWTWTCDGINNWAQANCGANLLVINCNVWENVVNWSCKDPYWSNTALLMHMDGPTTSAEIGTVTTAWITLTGSIYKIGSGSFYNDVDAGLVDQVATNNTNFGTDDFTIEMWARRTRRQADYSANLINLSASISIQCDDLAASDTNNELQFITPTWMVKYSTYMAMNTWYHLAIVRKLGVVTAYVNGISMGHFNDTTNYWQLPVRLFSRYAKYTAGASPNFRSFFGYLDEVRITKWVARYTTNFTPQTQAFPNQ